MLPGTSNKATFAVHRVKGRLRLHNGEVHMVQGVREVFEITKQQGEHVQAEEEVGKLVIIGKHVAEMPWQQSLEQSIESE